MRESEHHYDAEFAGALAPELEGAPRSRAHRRRNAPPIQQKQREDRGDHPSAKTDLPQAPNQP